MTNPGDRPTGPVLRWLVGSAEDRARYRDLHRRFSAAPVFGLLVGGSCLLVSWWAGWPVVALVATASLTMVVGVRCSRTAQVPEVVGAIAFAALELNLAASVAVSGGWDSPLLPLLAVPVFSQGVCLRGPVTIAGVVFSGVLAVLAGTMGAEWSVSVPGWVHLPVYLALLTALLLCVGYLADSDLRARDAAAVDPLTGLLNRHALAVQMANPLQLTSAVLMVDVDHFKRVNDEHGHAVGDLVLHEVGSRLVSTVRDGDAVFRFGGEEFLVLCPGADVTDAAGLAERLRTVVAAHPIAGIRVTVSIGVSAGPTTNLLTSTTLLGQADEALYAAKRAGRDNTHVGAPVRPVSAVLPGAGIAG